MRLASDKEITTTITQRMPVHLVTGMMIKPHTRHLNIKGIELEHSSKEVKASAIRITSLNIGIGPSYIQSNLEISTSFTQRKVMAKF